MGNFGPLKNSYILYLISKRGPNFAIVHSEGYRNVAFHPILIQLNCFFFELIAPRAFSCKPTYFLYLCAISTYHHQSYEFEPYSCLGVLDNKLCDKVSLLLVTDRWVSPVSPVSSTKKTDCMTIY